MGDVGVVYDNVYVVVGFFQFSADCCGGVGIGDVD